MQNTPAKIKTKDKMAEPTPLQSIARLNNQAVARLSVADVFTAAQILQNALYHFQHLPPPIGNVEVPENSTYGNGSIQYKELHLKLRENSAAMSPHNLFELCPYVFLLPEGNDGDETDTALFNRAHFFTVLLYNLSVTVYCVGVKRTQHSSFKKSLHLIDLVLSVHQYKGHIDDDALGGQMGLVLLAAEYHRAHLLSHFCRTDQVWDRQKMISAALRQLESDVESDDCMLFFFLAYQLQTSDFPTIAASA